MQPRTFFRLLRAHADALSAAAALLALAVAVLLGVPAPQPPMEARHPLAPSQTALPLETVSPPEGARPEILVLALPGIGQSLAERALGEGTLHHLGHLAAQGVYVPALRLPETASPGWAEWVLSTGETEPPPPEWEALHAEQPETACAAWTRVNATSSPLWRKAEAVGGRVGLVLWPEGLPFGCEQVASVQVEGWVQDLPAERTEVRLSPAEGWQGLPFSYSPPLQGTVVLSDGAGRPVGELRLVALDRRNDGVALYDYLLLDHDQDAGEGAVLFRTDEWADGWIFPDQGIVAAFRALGVQQGAEVHIALYRSPAYHLGVQPQARWKRLASEVGPFSPPPDLKAWQEGWLSGTQALEMALRHGRGLRRMVDALYQEGGLAALWVRWTPMERALQVAEGLGPEVPSASRQVLRWMDGDVGQLLQRVDLSRTAVVVIFLPSEGSEERAGALIAAGRGVRRGVVEEPWPVAEVTGFLAALMGLDAPATSSAYARALRP